MVDSPRIESRNAEDLEDRVSLNHAAGMVDVSGVLSVFVDLRIESVAHKVTSMTL